MQLLMIMKYDFSNNVRNIFAYFQRYIDFMFNIDECLMEIIVRTNNQLYSNAITMLSISDGFLEFHLEVGKEWQSWRKILRYTLLPS